MAVKEEAQLTRRGSRLPDLQPGKYSDGLPLDEVKYLECKIILRPNHFTSRQSLFDFGKVLRRPAKESGVGFDTKGFADEPLQIREVLFLDTADFQLYNNAFILRRRIPYQDGFPTGDPEIVFKYRHTDLQTTAEMDVRPRITGNYQIKFKAEALPLKDGLGGIRMLYSHNVEFGLSSLRESDRASMDTIVRVLQQSSRSGGPRTRRSNWSAGRSSRRCFRISGCWTSGRASPPWPTWRCGATAATTVRSSGSSRCRIKFKRREELNERAVMRGKAFFLSLQNAARDWVALGATKTGVVYRLKGNPPHAHE